MNLNVISLAAATSSENLQALQEVSQFASTDMGRGGLERWTYRVLSEPSLTAELARLSNARSSGGTDSLSFQPCQTFESRSQDRYCLDHWEMPGGIWAFAAVFDGHANHDTVDYVARWLPSIIQRSLQSCLKNTPRSALSPNAISKLLSDAIVGLDDSIRTDFLKLFGNDLGRLESMTDQETKQIIYDQTSGGINGQVVNRCLQGTTVLVTLTDPGRNHLWVANLGDSLAVLALRGTSNVWTGRSINAVHNGSNPEERRRVRREHPGERECIQDERVVGYLAPTRAIGDTWLKLPAAYTTHVFANVDPEWIAPSRVGEFAGRIIRPPYVSNIPDVYHIVLRDPRRHGHDDEAFVIMCTDGLSDLYDNFSHQEMVDRWTTIVGRAIDSPGNGDTRVNAALSLLRDAVGGDDNRKVSQNLTVEMEERWMDDTTIIVQHFR